MHAYMSSALDEAGVDLLQQLLRYNPDERISVRCPQGAASTGRARCVSVRRRPPVRPVP